MHNPNPQPNQEQVPPNLNAVVPPNQGPLKQPVAAPPNQHSPSNQNTYFQNWNPNQAQDSEPKTINE